MNSLCLCCRRHHGLFAFSTTSLFRCAPPVSRHRTYSSNTPRRRPGHLLYDIAAEFISKTPVNMAVNERCSRPYTVFVEGNVGSGKTTFLEQFVDCPNVYLAKEPVHKWQDVRGHNFLVSTASYRDLAAATYFRPSPPVLYTFFTHAQCIVSCRFSRA